MRQDWILDDPIIATQISNIALELINRPSWDESQIHAADIILKISNIAYNNTSADVLLLDGFLFIPF